MKKGLLTAAYALAFLTILFCPKAVSAQNPNRITGTILNTDAEPVPGVSVKVKGRPQGTSSDEAGKFTLNAGPNAVLEITHGGYKNQELRVGTTKDFNIVMERTAADLDEVVVLGYGTVRKSDLTGSVSSLKFKDEDKHRVVSIPEALQGKVSGVQIMNNTGEPGSGMTFRIRGSTSITGSNQPLIVIDGQPIESGLGAASAGMGLDWMTEAPPSDPLATLNPNDIESIEILKDASATAIYGSRGANGVVMITTKSGSNKAGKDRFSYSTRVDFSQMPNKIPMASVYDYMTYRNEANINDGMDSAFTKQEIDSLGPLFLGQNDFQEIIYRTAISQDHQVSASGGDDKTKYFISGNYTDQESVILNAGFQRGGLRFNFNRDLTKRLKIGIRSNLSFANRDYGQQSNSQGNLASSVVMGALAFSPLRGAYNPDGDLDESFANNPVLVSRLVRDKTQIRNITAHMNLDYNIGKGLSYQLKAGVNDMNSVRQQYWPRGTFQGNSYGGSATRAENVNSNYMVDHILSYRKKIKKHRINAVGGYSYQMWNNKGVSQTNTGFPTDALGYNNFALAEKPGITRTSNRSRSLSSLLGRVNYTYDSRYLFTLTGRYDGASRLADDLKWQLFPSAAIGWNVYEEKFFDKISNVVSHLKFRASYGIAGNENIAIGATQSTYAINYAVINQSIIPGFALDNFENNTLTWEKTAQLNAGMDISFLNDRLSFSADYFRKTTTDLLINLAVPTSSTFNDYFTNIGKIYNEGVDIEAKYNTGLGKVQFDFYGNISFIRNEVVNLGTADVIYGRNYINGGNVLLNQPLHVALAGFPISSFWGYKTDGIYQNADDVAKGPEAGSARPGDVRFVDTNGDGAITDADKTIIGNPNPDFTYGFGSTVAYKNFSLSFSFLGSQGQDLINLNQWIIGSLNGTSNFNQRKAAFDGRWTGEGTSNFYPAPTNRSPRFGAKFPSYMVEDASFFRLQQLLLSYRIGLPAKWRMGGANVYVSGTNLFTITNYSGYDPNVNAFGHSALQAGVDYGTLPQSRTISAGIQLNW